MRLLLGGSPCTHWSIAQTKNRETEPSGLGWELFKNYLIAREKYKPDYFLYENNKSMAAAIREQITKELGVPPVLINSALVSAQNRQRLYWAGKRMPDGSYAPLDIQQPEDRGILLRDILETVTSEKGYILKPAGKPLTEREMEYMVRETSGGRNHFDFDYHHDSTKDKGSCVTANTHRGVPYNVLAEPTACRCRGRKDKDGNGYAKYECRNDKKANTLDTNTVNGSMVAEPIPQPITPYVVGKLDAAVEKHGYVPAMWNPYNNAEITDKAPTLTAQCNRQTTSATVIVADQVPQKEVPMCINQTPNGKSRTVDAHIKKLENNLIPRINNPNPAKQQYDCIAEPVRVGTIESEAKNEDHDSQQYRVYSTDGKSVTLCGAGGGIGAKTGLYAVRVTDCQPVNATVAGKAQCLRATYYKDGIRNMVGNNVDKKTCIAEPIKTADGQLEVQTADGKTYPIYEVKGGYITVKGKRYPIKLADGFYIIRKLTVTECKRLQTVPDSYVFPVSDSQAYKMLGNGWTVEVIAHILSHIPEIATEPLEVLSMYDGMSCGHLALDRLGAEVVGYFATEIDKYAIQTTQHNYPDTVQLGDAFQVREDGWRVPEEL